MTVIGSVYSTLTDVQLWLVKDNQLADVDGDGEVVENIENSKISQIRSRYQISRCCSLPTCPIGRLRASNSSIKD